MSVLLNSKPIGNLCYPNNERIFDIKGVPVYNKNLITLNYETDIDISILAIVSGYIDDVAPKAEKELTMRYIPYERMDRKIDGYIFSLKYFCKFINSLNFSKVYVLCAHSGISTALIDRVVEMDISQHVFSSIGESKADVIFYPDNGAKKRYSELFNKDSDSYTVRSIASLPYFFGDKQRDLDTGKILHYDLINAPDITGKNVLIIDDLCSKGYTFLMAAKALKEAGAKTVSLYVSHCENSISSGELLTTDWIDKIFTTTSLPHETHKKILHMD